MVGKITGSPCHSAKFEPLIAYKPRKVVIMTEWPSKDKYPVPRLFGFRATNGHGLPPPLGYPVALWEVGKIYQFLRWSLDECGVGFPSIINVSYDYFYVTTDNPRYDF